MILYRVETDDIRELNEVLERISVRLEQILNRQLEAQKQVAEFVQNSGDSINTGSTFDGYTIQQLVEILGRIGLIK